MFQIYKIDRVKNKTKTKTNYSNFNKQNCKYLQYCKYLK